MRKILIVDDQEDMRDLIRCLFEESHFDAYEAVNGAEALIMASEISPDLIILDIQMPVMDGWEFLRRLRANEAYRFVPVMIVSGSRGAKDVFMRERPEACVFVSKPFEISVLEKTIEGMLSRGNAQYEDLAVCWMR